MSVDDALAALVLLLAAPLMVCALHRGFLTLLHYRVGVHKFTSSRETITDFPRVTVQLPLYNEPLVAERLLDAVAALDWPRDRLEVQVLDDSTDATTERVAARVAELRAGGLDVVHVRRGTRAGFKAGALAHGLQSARGELVLVLDADFVPAPDLLRRAAPCFADPRVAVAQLRWEHLNRACGWLTEAQALMLDGHFVVEQHARAASHRFFNFNGTAGVWRRAAIDDAGGWSDATLTEDLDLSYRAQLRGWRFVYLPDAACPAELPVTVAAFKSQQFRWAKGSVQCARRLGLELARARLPWRVRLEALLHLGSNAAYPLTLALALVLAALEWPMLRSAAVDRLTTAAAPAFTVATACYVAYYLAAQRRLRGVLGSLARVPLVMAVGLGLSASQTRAVLEGLFQDAGEFVRTPKTGAVGRHAGVRARAARTRMPFLEALLAAWFAVALGLALADGRLLVVPLFALAAAGFAAIAASQLRWR